MSSNNTNSSNSSKTTEPDNSGNLSFGELLEGGNNDTNNIGAPPSGAIQKYSSQLKTVGGFVSKQAPVHQRHLANPGQQRANGGGGGGDSSGGGVVQARTRDSIVAMRQASSYSPAMPTNVAISTPHTDIHAPMGYRQALPEGYTESYIEDRRKRCREIVGHSLKSRQQREDAAARSLGLAGLGGDVAGDEGGGASSTSTKGRRVEAGSSVDGASMKAPVGTYVRDITEEFADIEMPANLPRDEYGVKIGNYPEGVRFVRDAIRACGGALELDTIVQRLSTLGSFNEANSKFGDVRRFLTIHHPTFRLEQEHEKWVVRLKENDANSAVNVVSEDENGVRRFTWERMACPLCTRILKGRNLARHLNCRRCVAMQVAQGRSASQRGILSENLSPISAVAAASFYILGRYYMLAKEELYPLTSGAVMDDDDIGHFEKCILAAANVKRYKLSSCRVFAPILNAIRLVHKRWLALHPSAKGDVRNIKVGASDASFVSFFATLGSVIRRLPIPWIETGEIIAMCSRFCTTVLPAFHPPPRPADPRITVGNDFPGILFCESEIDSEDEISDGDEEAGFSDEEEEQFVFAPPVSTAESIFTAGFERDTRRLQHRLLTKPPMVLSKALRNDMLRSHQDAYKEPVA